MSCEPVTVEKVTLERTMKHKGVPVLHYKIEYPKFIHSQYQNQLDQINCWYQCKAEDLQKEFETVNYRDASEQYDFSLKENYPFPMHEAMVVFHITYNQDCCISLYQDKYIFSGGAHGNTLRTSDTWNVMTGCLYTLYGNRSDWEQVQKNILNQIDGQIKEHLAKGEDWYFDDYSKLVAETFNPQSFYVTPEGIMIYFQQYDIAPYSSGIQEFLVRTDQ
ncbi:DUF3298 and DUF4163 domain-containing protein [Anoxybacterium hadale]|uniref:DUF3298 and DUF4163 domain-containing protein n=1 Tax=Anoxybacterium hadale TaxID=3408580 RepID=A0ACD1A8C5_9FIRM|nr:DUF3298 and DUF4163 domain-containing protein [Clostridiales bacterium]